MIEPYNAVGLIPSFWGIRRLACAELSRLPERTRRGLRALRGATVLLLLVFLVEPTCTRRSADVELPKVVVLLDRSGSMAARDVAMSARLRLDEATALGLVPAELRDVAMKDAEATVAAAIEDVPAIANALADRAGPQSRSGDQIETRLAQDGAMNAGRRP